MKSIMAQPILGLDLGSSSVKAVCLRKGWMGLEWAGGYQRDISHPPGPFDWAREAVPGLKEWIAEHQLPMDHVVVSLPAHLISLRTLTLPFNDERKLEKVVPFEIEALLPYPLEEVVVDYQVTDATQGRTNLLAAAVPRGLVKNYLEQLSRAGINPEAVELDGMALTNLVRHVFPDSSALGDPAGGMAALEIGASKTVVCILRHGQTAFVRTILWGGRDVTAALSDACGIPLAEAEEWKRQAGLLDEEISRLHQKGVSQTIRRALEPFISELARTVHVFQANEPPEGRVPLTEFVLYGGGSKLKGLESHLASELGLQAVTRAPKIASGNGAGWDPAFALSLGLALKAARVTGGSRMNFRKGEFAHGREATASSARARYLWIGALLVASVAAADLYTKYTLQMGKYQTLKTQVREQFRTMFPDVKNVVDEVQQAKSTVAEMKKKVALFGTSDWTPLQLMAELTQRMPPSVKIEVQDFVIEPGRLRLEAETDSFESVDKVKSLLGQFGAFRDVTVSDAKVSADQSKVRFRLTMTVASKESDRGNK
ncbi:MAG: type IV pilus assembly protein PilM [Nitrospirae bacterium]|nr:type IV pilus assembly protein PilM [Nitrospirota bacterium]